MEIIRTANGNEIGSGPEGWLPVYDGAVPPDLDIAPGQLTRTSPEVEAKIAELFKTAEKADRRLSEGPSADNREPYRRPA